jgi:hypothetical protein
VERLREVRFDAVPEDAWSQAVAQISALLAAYSDRIDSGDLEGLADLLAHASFGAGEGPLVEGRDKILKLYRGTVRIYDDGTPRTRHLVTNLVVDVDPGGATASARSYWTVLQATPEMALCPILSGRYRDRFSISDGSWWFTERRIITDLVGDVSHHMLPGAERLVR